MTSQSDNVTKPKTQEGNQLAARQMIFNLVKFCDICAGEGISFVTYPGVDDICPADLLSDWWDMVDRPSEYSPEAVADSIITSLNGGQNA